MVIFCDQLLNWPIEPINGYISAHENSTITKRKVTPRIKEEIKTLNSRIFAFSKLFNNGFITAHEYVIC